METRVRYGAAIAYVGFITLFVYAWALFDFEIGSGALAWTVNLLFFTLAFLVGLLVGRWWVFPLLLLPVVLAIPLGENPHDSDRWPYWYLLLLPGVFLSLPLTLAGYLIRLVVDHWPRIRGPRTMPLPIWDPGSRHGHT